MIYFIQQIRICRYKSGQKATAAHSSYICLGFSPHPPRSGPPGLACGLGPVRLWKPTGLPFTTEPSYAAPAGAGKEKASFPIERARKFTLVLWQEYKHPRRIASNNIVTKTILYVYRTPSLVISSQKRFLYVYRTLSFVKSALSPYPPQRGAGGPLRGGWGEKPRSM